MSYRQLLKYDALLRDPNSWRLHEGKLQARIKVAEGPDTTVAVHFRCGRSRVHLPGWLFLRRLDPDGESWLSESAKLHDSVPRLELLLRQCPPEIADKIDKT